MDQRKIVSKEMKTNANKSKLVFCIMLECIDFGSDVLGSTQAVGRAAFTIFTD